MKSITTKDTTTKSATTGAARFTDRLKREEECTNRTYSDPELKVLCASIERGLELMEDSTRELVEAKWEADASPQNATLMLLFAWNMHQLTAGFEATLAGNYAAAVSNIRQGFEGVVFMRKYSSDRRAAEKWLANPNYEDDKVHSILKELTAKPGGSKLANYPAHYSLLSRLAHPYPRMRSLFLEESKGNATVSLGGKFNKTWAAILLTEIIFSIGQGIEIIASTLRQSADAKLASQLSIYLEKYADFYPHVSKYLSTLKTEVKNTG